MIVWWVVLLVLSAFALMSSVLNAAGTTGGARRVWTALGVMNTAAGCLAGWMVWVLM